MGKWYFSILPMVLVAVGTFLKGKDSNNTGADDAVGNICLAAAPAAQSLQDNNETGVRKAMQAIRDAADAYLQQSPAPTK
jgi:hypothetical protein